MQYPANVRVLKFPCTGRIDPVFILRAFQKGADGVLVSGCHPGDCHYMAGNFHARRRFAAFRKLLEFVGSISTACSSPGSPPPRGASGWKWSPV